MNDNRDLDIACRVLDMIDETEGELSPRIRMSQHL